ncbi:hypothetical protein HYC85_000059 [Camellia sinensis]|uniref:ABC transmembrane type-1 domain-containing protein n=1 Tax=Camellia sinensis TaxID=4442 RepID=A0A7J7FPD0_CAMSI|nr:hypothetical protein HYC85_000059 [Camellia sinensis]
MMHSAGEIMNYVSTDAYRIGEFPFWFYQTWTTSLQLCLALIILFRAVGLATIASLVVIILTVLCNAPLAKLQHKFQSKLMVAQDDRLKATSEALVNMKVLKLYAWESHFKNVIENLRKMECKWLSAVQMRKAYNGFLFWASPVLVSTATFGACYFLGVPLHASNVFTFVATLRLVQEPEYVMAALSMKTVLLVTHQVDFLPAFDSILLMSDGEILYAAPHHQLLASSREFQDLFNAHKETDGTERLEEVSSSQKRETSTKEIRKTHTDEKSKGDQLIKQEEREISLHGCSWHAIVKIFVFTATKLSFSCAHVILKHYALGRILSRASADLSIVDLDVPFGFIYSVVSIINTYANLVVMAVVTWQVLFISIPMIYLAILLQVNLGDIILFFF